MPHQLTPDQGNALHYHALALRPDWKNNNPGQTWRHQLTNNTLPHAQNYEHALNALTAYATQTNPKLKTPNLYPNPGQWWETTQPNPGVANPTHPPCQQHDQNKYTPTKICAGCRAEELTIGRPPHLHKQIWHPQKATEQAQDDEQEAGR